MVEVRRSTILDAPVEEVWRLLRDFNGHAGWHPAVAESRLEAERGGDEIGAVRRFRLAEGGWLREQLLSLSDRERQVTYCILEAPLPLGGYVATLQLRPVTDGNRTFWDWRCRFDAPPGEAAGLAALVAEEIYEAGFAAVRQHLGGAPRPAATAGRPLEGRAVVLLRHGGPDALALQRLEAPPPGPGEVRLRQTAVGVNFIDVYCRTGYFDLVQPPGVLGMEAAGVVLDVGDGVTGLAPGDRVAYAGLPPGAYAELRTLPADILVPLPEGVSDELAAAALLKGMTAEFLLHRVEPVREGQTILVHAAAGGVGSLLCQWASQLGCRVIGTVGSRDKAGQALANGCAQVIVAAEEDFVERALALTEGRGVDAIYDALGRDSVNRGWRALALRGHLVSYGQAAGPLEPLDLAALASRSARLSRPNYGHYAGSPEQLRLSSGRLFAALARGWLRPAIGLTLPLAEAAEAHRRLEGRQTTGSVVLVP